ncbi:MAG: hypothetical protein LBK77_04010 [Spirochaetaceae bacterium]|jgi:hypothetical protein|nr:hypothetical protein [Spirochaetaceae bacterium]
MKGLLLTPVLFVLSAGLIFSFDFGLLADQKIEAEEKVFSYTPVLTPWFSWNKGRFFSFYFSGIFSFKYSNYNDDGDGWNKPGLLPELGRFALNYRSGPRFHLEAGRIGYTDALGFAASGLFDGLCIKADLSRSSITAGVWYTGLLYKETAKILMTAGDMKSYAEPWDWDNFSGYFAPRRLLNAFRRETPLGEFHSLSLEALAQFDLTGNDEGLHSQYGELLAEFFPSGASGTLGINIGGLFEIMESREGTCTAAFGGLARLKTDIPGALNDGLSLTIKFTSGQWNDAYAVFKPLSSSAQGAVFSGTLSGLALVSTGYTARLHRALLLESALRYFLRTYDDPATEGKYSYGGEVWASLAWQPLEDLRLTLEGAAFFPALGNVYPANPQWKLSAGLSLTF